jgi:hypothetical protein
LHTTVCVGKTARHYLGDDSYPLGNVVSLDKGTSTQNGGGADKDGPLRQLYNGGAPCGGR